MTKDDSDCVIRIILDLQVHHAACKILEVGGNVSKVELENAHRRASLRYHPDFNATDPNANRRFTLIRCSYELLAEHEPCAALLREIHSWDGFPRDSKYKLENPWGLFLWWRDRLFGSEEKTRSGKCTSCI